MAEKYNVTVHKGIKTAYRYRAGFQFVRGEDNIVELSSEQVKAIKADKFLLIAKAKKAEVENGTELRPYSEQTAPPVAEDKVTDTGENADEGDSDEQGDGEGEGEGTGEGEQTGSDEETGDEGKADEVSTENDNQDEGKTDEGSDKAPEDEPSKPVVYTVEALCKENNRDELNDIAIKAGIEDATDIKKYEFKKDIAEAIVAKQNEG